MPISSARPTLLWIQALRALAALVVVWAHTNAETGWFAYYVNKPSELPSFVTGAAGVDLFFVISGFVMVYSSESLFGSLDGSRTFLIRRLLRIVPLYWLTTAATLLAWRHFGISWEMQGMGWENLISSLAFVAWPHVGVTEPGWGNTGPIVAVGWTLFYEMFFYLCFGIAVIARPRVAIIGTAIFLIWFSEYGHSLPLPYPLIYVANRCLWEFALGLGIAFVWREGLRLPWYVAALLMCAGLGIIIAKSFEAAEPDRFIYWALPCALIVLGASMMPNPSLSSRFWPVATLLGDASYAIYLTHGIVMMSIRMQWLNFSVWLYQWPWVHAAFIAAASTAVGCLIHVAIERPITLLLKRRLARARDLPAVMVQTAA